jgi:hypothetical protein
MRRDPIVRQAIPGRELDHWNIRREEPDGARKCRHARTVAADDGGTHCRIRMRSNYASEIGDDKSLRPVSDPA